GRSSPVSAARSLNDSLSSELARRAVLIGPCHFIALDGYLGLEASLAVDFLLGRDEQIVAAVEAVGPLDPRPGNLPVPGKLNNDTTGDTGDTGGFPLADDGFLVLRLLASGHSQKHTTNQGYSNGTHCLSPRPGCAGGELLDLVSGACRCPGPILRLPSLALRG